MNDDSMTRAADEFAQRLVADEEPEQVIAQMAAFVRVLVRSRRLAKVFGNSGVPLDAKGTLLQDLAGSLSPVARHGVLQLVTADRRSNVSLVSYAVDSLAQLVFAVADRQDRLDLVQTQLHDAATLIRSNLDLRDALTSLATSDDAKDALVTDVFSGADPSVIELLRVLTARDHGRGVDIGAEVMAHAAAARRNRVVAEVQTAVELDDDRRERLAAKLSEVLGKTVDPRFTVNPSIVGSVVVRVGDDILDGSVRRRFDQARLTVVGVGS